MLLSEAQRGILTGSGFRVQPYIWNSTPESHKGHKFIDSRRLRNGVRKYAGFYTSMSLRVVVTGVGIYFGCEDLDLGLGFGFIGFGIDDPLNPKPRRSRRDTLEVGRWGGARALGEGMLD